MATSTSVSTTSDLQSRPSSLPPPFSTSPESFTLITQGAEALVYKTTFLTHTQPAALKIRPQKTWRHPILDKRLTKQRIIAEARVLVKCRKEGVPVPAVLGLDWEAGWTAVEWLEGVTVKAAIRERKHEGGEVEGLKGLLRRVGEVVGRLHSVGVIHGDLTTSNMMVRSKTNTTTTTSSSSSSDSDGNSGGGELDGEIVLIDFGLASQAQQEEDRAVDLYVLERAFGSTHPREEELFGVVLEAYGGAYKGAKSTLRRLEDVRMRGRKKSMLG